MCVHVVRRVQGSERYHIMTTVLSLLQFVKHGSDLERTKMKLLEAANYVDKVVTEKSVVYIRKILFSLF